MFHLYFIMPSHKGTDNSTIYSSTFWNPEKNTIFLSDLLYIIDQLHFGFPPPPSSVTRVYLKPVLQQCIYSWCFKIKKYRIYCFLDCLFQWYHILVSERERKCGLLNRYLFYSHCIPYLNYYLIFHYVWFFFLNPCQLVCWSFSISWSTILTLLLSAISLCFFRI